MKDEWEVDFVMGVIRRDEERRAFVDVILESTTVDVRDVVCGECLLRVRNICDSCGGIVPPNSPWKCDYRDSKHLCLTCRRFA